MVSLDTDKVSSELEAEASGIVTIKVVEGTEVGIGEKLGSIAESDAPVRKASPVSVLDEPATEIEATPQAR